MEVPNQKHHETARSSTQYIQLGVILDPSIRTCSMDPIGATEIPEDQADRAEIPEASEILEGLFVGTAEAGTEATVGANQRHIGYILNVGGCVTPAIFAALAEALALEEVDRELKEEKEVPETEEEVPRVKNFRIISLSERI